MNRPIVGAAVLLLAACHPAGAPSPAADRAAAPGRILGDIRYLASDALEGRATGTPGADSAARFIARRLEALGLRPVGVDYAIPFTARSIELAHEGKPFEIPGRNVAALVPGTDPALRGEALVLGAHYDHLGRSARSALDPKAADAIRNGADDNASGTAAVLELARRFSHRPARRPVIVVLFDGEEMGLLGSRDFVEHPPVPLDSIEAMLNFDMVGRLRERRLLVYGVASATELPAIVDSANRALGADSLAVHALGDGTGPSDHASFYLKGVPVLHFFTDLHDDYHRATDDVEKIDAVGEARVVDLAEAVARRLADRPGRLTMQRAAPRPTITVASGNTKVWFGSVPDMGAADVKGVRLGGVTPGSPAEQAGLREGDIIVGFDGKPVTDLYTYSDALYAKKPGDTVSVVVMRGNERLTMSATLGER